MKCVGRSAIGSHFRLCLQLNAGLDRHHYSIHINDPLPKTR